MSLVAVTQPFRCSACGQAFLPQEGGHCGQCGKLFCRGHLGLMRFALPGRSPMRCRDCIKLGPGPNPAKPP